MEAESPRGPDDASASIVSGTLCNGDIGGTNVHQSVSYSPKRGIEIAGSDYGRAPKAAFGSSEYEYWRTVKPELVGQFFYTLLKQSGLPWEPFSGERLIELICTRFGGDHNAEKRFRTWCEDHGIPTEFFSWVSSG